MSIWSQSFFDNALDSRCLCRECKSGKRQIPAGSKLLRSEKKGEMVLCVFGIFHSCEKFVNISRSLWHPFDQAAHMLDYLFEHLTNSPTELVKLRISNSGLSGLLNYQQKAAL